MNEMPETAHLNAQLGRVVIRVGAFNVRASIRVTPTGLLSIGGLVGTVLVSTALLVWTAGAVKRGHLLK